MSTALALVPRRDCAAKYAVEFFARTRLPSYALWAVTCKDPESGRYPPLPTAYGRTETLEQARLDLTAWCEARGLTLAMLRQDMHPWRLVKDLLDGKSGAEWLARQAERRRLKTEPAESARDIQGAAEGPGAAGGLVRIIEARQGRPMVSSLTIAEIFERRHDSVLRAIRTVQATQGGLRIRAETSLDSQGKERPVYWLDEEAALVIMPFLGGKNALDGQLKLVRAYLYYRDQFANPPRSDLLQAKRAANRTLNAALAEVLTEAGKDPLPHHFSNEARLCNWVVTGSFAPLDESTLSNADAALLEQVRDRDRAFLLAGLDYATRKERLSAFAIRARTRQIGAPEQERAA